MSPQAFITNFEHLSPQYQTSIFKFDLVQKIKLW